MFLDLPVKSVVQQFMGEGAGPVSARGKSVDFLAYFGDPGSLITATET